MPDLSALIQQGATNLLLFIPTAILLGALHGLEPGHSKTMMAAFIVAIRGTVTQAILLGLAATVSHTAIVWGIALTGVYFLGGKFDSETTEPYFQIGSAVLIIGIAVWMLYRTWRDKQNFDALQGHGHSHDETRTIDTGHEVLKLEIFEVGQPPRFRVSAMSGGALKNYVPKDAGIETIRPDGTVQLFHFAEKGDLWESTSDIPEPHEFKVRLSLSHGDHGHAYDVEFKEHHQHHDQDPSGEQSPQEREYQDAHERAHADDIQKRFSAKAVTTPQIILFGLTGGLIPCPASITVLLLCLQLKKIALGALLVLCFSIGLALTMVLAGVIAAVSVSHVSKRWSGFSLLARRAPYFSSGVIIIIGLYVGYNGVLALARGHA